MIEIYKDDFVELYTSDGMYWMHTLGDPYTIPGWGNIIDASQSLEAASRALLEWNG